MSLCGTDSPHRGSEFYHKQCDELGHVRGMAKAVDSKIVDVASESRLLFCRDIYLLIAHLLADCFLT